MNLRCCPLPPSIFRNLDEDIKRTTPKKYFLTCWDFCSNFEIAEFDGVELREFLLPKLGGIVFPIPLGLTLVFGCFLMGEGLRFTEKETSKRSNLERKCLFYYITNILDLVQYSFCTLSLGCRVRKAEESTAVFPCSITSQTFHIILHLMGWWW